RPAHRADDRQLAEGIVEMVVAADHVSDPHVVIVDHDRKHIGWGAVRAEQDEIVDFAILDGNATLDAILDHRFALAGSFQPDNEGLASLLLRHVTPGAVDAEGPALLCRKLALLGQLLLRHVAAISGPAIKEPVSNLGMTGPELGLVIF